MLHERSMPQWEQPGDFLKYDKLCSASGMPAEAGCSETFSGWTMPGFSLPACDVCGRKIRKPLNIVSPRSTVYIAEGNGAEIPLECHENALWFVDGNYIGAVEKGASLFFAPGAHKVRVVSPDDSQASAAVEFTVKL